MMKNNGLRLLSVVMLIAVHHNVQTSHDNDRRWTLLRMLRICSCTSSASQNVDVPTSVPTQNNQQLDAINRDVQNESPAVDMVKVVNRKNSGTYDQNNQVRATEFTNRAPNCQSPHASYSHNQNNAISYKKFLDERREKSATNSAYDSVCDLPVMRGYCGQPMTNGSIVINETFIRIGGDRQALTSSTIAKNVTHPKDEADHE